MLSQLSCVMCDMLVCKFVHIYVCGSVITERERE